jgi:hypothetical protein
MAEKEKGPSAKLIIHWWNSGQKGQAVEAFKAMPNGPQKNTVLKECSGIKNHR